MVEKYGISSWLTNLDKKANTFIERHFRVFQNSYAYPNTVNTSEPVSQLSPTKNITPYSLPLLPRRFSDTEDRGGVSLNASLNFDEQLMNIFEAQLNQLSHTQLIELCTLLIHRFHVGWLTYNTHLTDPLQNEEADELLQKVRMYLDNHEKALPLVTAYLSGNLEFKVDNDTSLSILDRFSKIRRLI